MAYLPYKITDFRGGISDENDRGIAGSFKHGYGVDIRSRDNTISCNQAMLDITPAGMNDLVRWWVNASDGSVYAFGSAGSIWARSGDGTWTFAYNDENGEIRGAAEWGNGIDQYLYWATATSLARKKINSEALVWTDATQDYKTTLDDVPYHTMRVSANGILAIANAEELASIDIDGNFEVDVLNLSPGNLIKALEDRDDYVIAGTYRDDQSEDGHIFSWVVTALSYVQKKRIPVKGVNAMLYTEYPIIQGGTDGELFFSDFTDAIPLVRGGGGGQVNPGGVTIYNDIAHFGFYDGDYPGIWSYGRKRKTHPFALNYDYRLSPTVAGSTVTEIGGITTVNGVMFASWATTDESTVEYGIDELSTTTKATAVYEGLEFNNGEPHLERTYQLVKLLTKPMPSGTSVSAKFKLDYDDTWRYAVMGNGSTTHAVSEGHNSTIAEFMIEDTGVPFEVGVEANPYGNDTIDVKGVVTYVSKEGDDYA